MGSQVFWTKGKGKTPSEAFDEARRRAEYDYGHGGYTGSIAEKDQFVLIPLPKGKSAVDFASELIEDKDERIDDKWGPAGCVEMQPGTYLFFGWASC